MRKVEFTEEEKLKGLNAVNLFEFGDFRAEYFFDDDNVWALYGWWTPTEEAAEQEGLDLRKAPFWARLVFIPEYYLDDEELTEASEVLYIPWTDWVVIVEEEQR